jgi:hypothetical protein
MGTMWVTGSSAAFQLRTQYQLRGSKGVPWKFFKSLPRSRSPGTKRLTMAKLRIKSTTGMSISPEKDP